MAKKPSLSLVSPASTGSQPPRKLGEHGLNLWNAVTSEYRIEDRGGIELLAQICAATDRAEALAAEIDRDGETILTKGGLRAHPCLKDELNCRAFIARNLLRLGICVEAVKPTGRPGSGIGWVPPK